MIREPDPQAQEVVLYALNLIDIGYHYGGKDPETGFDCSGLVSYVYNQAVGIPLKGSAADLAKFGDRVDRQDMQPGDLVFFNTRGRPHSHVGIYIGDNRFVHAPKTGSQVHIERLDNSYFSSRFEEARTLFS